jgi:L-ascorbate metabolism protein UlaG (beta-lactamase superfamily)
LRRRITELAFAASLAALGALLPSCLIGRAGLHASAVLFSTPAKVVKNRHPVAPDARLAVLWVGHATALVQIDDKVILTDPVFTDTVGQVSKRLVEPGIDPKDLPPVDVVLVSHMHYDHLSLGSLEMIQSRVRTLLLPRGGTAYLTDFSFPAYELATWQTWSKGDLRVTAVPVEHVGYRYGLDDAWMPEAFTGFVVEYHGLKVYFAGDTAYEQAKFVETAQRFPKIDLALMPIAPIEPRDFLRRFHVDPAEALQAFLDLGAKRMVPIHYDTFVISADEPGAALRALSVAQKNAQAKWDLHDRVIAPLAIGERRIFLKPGEGVTREDAASEPEPIDSVPATTTSTPAPPPAPTPTSTSKIPDDDKFE